MTQFLSGEPPSAETINAALFDFGFYHALVDVERMYAEYANHGRYGYDGGVMDQPEEYWSDMAMMRWLEMYVKYVATMPQLEQVSVFDTLKNTGTFGVDWLAHHGK